MSAQTSKKKTAESILFGRLARMIAMTSTALWATRPDSGHASRKAHREHLLRECPNASYLLYVAEQAWAEAAKAEAPATTPEEDDRDGLAVRVLKSLFKEQKKFERLAEDMGIGIDELSGVLRKLRARGLVDSNGLGLLLTTQGRREAKAIHGAVRDFVTGRGLGQ